MIAKAPTSPTDTSRRAQVRVALLLALLAFTLFPLEWLASRWPALEYMLDTLFDSALAHGIGHATLFTLLGVLLLAAVPGLRTQLARYYTLLLLAGLGQEAFQLWFKRRGLVFDDGRDLAIDLIGVTVALVIGVRRQRGRAPAPDAEG